MPEVTWQVRDEGTAQVIQQFQELTKAEQKAAIAAAGLSDQLGAAGRKDKEFRKLASGALELAGALGLVTSVSGAISAGMDEARRRIQATIAQAKEAQAFGANTDKNWGVLLANDPTLTAAQLAKFSGAVRNIAPQLGREGAQQATQILTDIRTGTPGATDEQQIEAFRIAARQTALTGVDDLSQMAPQAIANIKLQQALGPGATGTMAQNLLSIAGARAGIDTSKVAESLIPLIGREGATPAEKAALLGFGTAETAFDGGRISTGIGGLLSKLGKPEFSDAATGTSFTLSGDTKFAKFEDLLNKIQSKEINKDAGLRAFAGENETIIPLIEAILSKRETFDETLKLTRESTAGNRNLQEETIATALSERPQLKSTLRTRNISGEAGIRQEGDLAGRSAADVAQAIAERRKGLGIISGPIDDSVLAGIEKRALDASKKPGGLKEFEANQTIDDIESAFGIREATQAEALVGGSSKRRKAVGDAFRQGGEQAALKEVVAQGFITSSDGISGAERAALAATGISDEQLNKLQQAFLEGNRQLFRELFALLRENQLGHKKSDLAN